MLNVFQKKDKDLINLYGYVFQLNSPRKHELGKVVKIEKENNLLFLRFIDGERVLFKEKESSTLNVKLMKLEEIASLIFTLTRMNVGNFYINLSESNDKFAKIGVVTSEENGILEVTYPDLSTVKYISKDLQYTNRIGNFLEPAVLCSGRQLPTVLESLLNHFELKV